jgi:hypothetical protein
VVTAVTVAPLPLLGREGELRLKQSRIQSWILLRMRTELCNAIYSPLYTHTYITLTSAPTDSPKKSIET